MISTAIPHPLSSEAQGRLQRLLDRYVARGRSPHAVLALGTADGAHTWAGAAGVADPEGTVMEPDRPYFIASVSKLVITALVLQLHESGDLDLEGPAAEHLSGLAGLHVLDGVDHSVRITVRQLLGHTSGLPCFLEDRRRGEPSWYRRIAAGEDRAWTPDEALDRARELRPRFRPQEPRAGRQRAHYSDTGFLLLIMLIEAVTARSFAQAVQERVLAPLELGRTYLPGRSRPEDAAAPQPATIYRGDRPLDIPAVVRSSYDLVSTAPECLVLLRALLSGRLFDRPETDRLRTARFNRLFFPMRYGLGTMRFRIARVFSPTGRPLTLVGHSGATGTWLFHCPELDLVLAGAVDQVNGRQDPFRLAAHALRACAG